jgi:protoporphyrinogen oxidase
MRIIIIGAGPTGLGAAYRLNELAHKDWQIYEKNDHVGGLSASFQAKDGFWWDIGGHVMFSHYPYYDNVIKKVLGDEYLSHMRESWIWTMNRFVPYPFQNNIKYLPTKEREECLNGLIHAEKEKADSQNFSQWITATFGEGISKYFMIPYNRKVWAYPLNEMSKGWISERVSIVNSKRITQNINEDKDDISWGPNNKFIFPLHGGTGNVFKRISNLFKEKIHLKKELTQIDLLKKKILFNDGSYETYDKLISTIPLTEFIKKASLTRFYKYLKFLPYSSSYIVGIGLHDKCPSKKCWMYFPDDNSNFYRVTYFSNYSPNNVPKSDYYSLMAEISYSKYKIENINKITEDTIKGMINSELIQQEDKIVSEYVIDVKYSYPIPTIKRDDALKTIQSFLMENDVFSRGRFGAWRYEIGNMDHSFMQGVEAIDKIILGEDEKTWTL